MKRPVNALSSEALVFAEASRPLSHSVILSTCEDDDMPPMGLVLLLLPLPVRYRPKPRVPLPSVSQRTMSLSLPVEDEEEEQ